MIDASVPVRRPAAGSMWFGFSDGPLVPDAMLPFQFQLISRAISPARALALAVLEQAVTDVSDQRFARTRRGQRINWETHQWINADGREWPYSFTKSVRRTRSGRRLGPPLPSRSDGVLRPARCRIAAGSAAASGKGCVKARRMASTSSTSTGMSEGTTSMKHIVTSLAVVMIVACVTPLRSHAGDEVQDARVQKGKLWYDRYCTPCHGAGGSLGSAVFPDTRKPIDLRS